MSSTARQPKTVIFPLTLGSNPLHLQGVKETKIGEGTYANVYKGKSGYIVMNTSSSRS